MRDALGEPQSILVLGGTSEIGVAVAEQLADGRSPHVILAVRRPDAASGVTDRLRGAGVKSVDVVAFDADDVADHPRWVNEVFDRFGDIDVAIVAFGVLGGADANQQHEMAVAVARTNFLGSVSVLVPVVERLKHQGHGTVVVLSSVAGERVRKANFVYGASKAGLDGFAQGLGDALQGSGVRVMVVRPGFVHTRMTAGMKAPPFSTTPQAVAAAVVDGLRRDADVVWVPALLRWVMTAVRHLPRPVFRRLKV